MKLFANYKNMMQPAVGKLLVAAPFLEDAGFSRTVVLICEYAEDGIIGFVLNRQLEFEANAVVPDLDAPAGMAMFQGGPVRLDTLHMLHRPSVLGEGLEVAPGIFWGGSYELLQETMQRKGFVPENIRLFVGYSGWDMDQLQQEIEEGSWLVCDATEELVFRTDPSDLWKNAILSMGKEYENLVNLPINPQWN